MKHLEQSRTPESMSPCVLTVGVLGWGKGAGGQEGGVRAPHWRKLLDDIIIDGRDQQERGWDGTSTGAQPQLVTGRLMSGSTV